MYFTNLTHRQDFLNKWQRIAFIHFQDNSSKRASKGASWAYFKPGSHYSD